MKISLKASRVNAGYTLREVAKILHRDKNTIMNWENKKTPIPRDDFDALCKLYEIDQKYIK